MTFRDTLPHGCPPGALLVCDCRCSRGGRVCHGGFPRGALPTWGRRQGVVLFRASIGCVLSSWWRFLPCTLRNLGEENRDMCTDTVWITRIAKGKNHRTKRREGRSLLANPSNLRDLSCVERCNPCPAVAVTSAAVVVLPLCTTTSTTPIRTSSRASSAGLPVMQSSHGQILLCCTVLGRVVQLPWSLNSALAPSKHHHHHRCPLQRLDVSCY